MSPELSHRLRVRNVNRTCLLALVLFVVSLPLEARTRSVNGRGSIPPSASVVSGTVSSVNGNIIAVANGAVTIDSSGAKIVTRDGEATISAVTPGMQIHAAVATNVPTNAPLPATIIAVEEMPELFLLGEVQSVDTAGKSFVVLGRTVHVTNETSFGGGFSHNAGGFETIQPRQIVGVHADMQGTRIVAEAVHVMSQFPGSPQVVHGTVKSIGTGAWVITGRDGRDVNVTVNAQTRIAGTPKAGDVVTVLAATDSSNALVAVFIVKSDGAHAPGAGVQRFQGSVKATGDVWTIVDTSGSDIRVKVQANKTVILGDPRVGDRVEVAAEKQGDDWVALLIAKRMW